MDTYKPIMKSLLTIEDRRKALASFNIDDDTPDPRAMSEEELSAHIVGVIFAQNFILNRGLKLFGDKADVAVHKELSQIHMMDT